MSADLHTLLDTDPAAGLRGVAALMRERVEAATPGPWRDMQMGSEGSIVLAGGNTITTSRKPATCREFGDAAHIAAADPPFALAVADFLDFAAPFAHQPMPYAPTIDHAMRIARAYLPPCEEQS